MKYQPEVDGLRALAVVPVVLFHAGFPQFAGGFVGVDVFFVISGYLITGIIRQDIDRGSFSILNFYERRVRRIMPALMLVISASLGGGLILFLPYQLEALGWSAISAIAFTSNMWFWTQTGYFAGGGDLDPLLHTWSLAVEEQFYLFFPLGIAALVKLRRRVLPFVVAVFALSLVMAELLVHRMPSAAFYLLPTRAWELMVGAMLSLGAMPPLRREGFRDAAALAGLTLILGPVLLYGPQTVFPGLSALPPCLGAAMIIAAGKQGGGRVTDLLGSRLPVGIGLISYSLYLWHWPIFVFSRQLGASPELSVGAALAGIILSVVLAWATWRYVEAPFRNRARLSRNSIFRIATSLAVLVGAAAAGATTGVPARFEPRALGLLRGREDVPPQVHTCIIDAGNDSACPLGAGGAADFAVWGDSHSAALGGAIDLAGMARRRSGLLFAFNGCPPGVGAPSPTISPPDQLRCRERNDAVRSRLLRDPGIKTVILSAYWQNYLDRAPGELLAAVGRTAHELKQGGKEVVVLANLPVPGYNVPWVTALASHRGHTPPPPHRQPRVDPRLAGMIVRSGARLIDMSRPFCRSDRCDVQERGTPLFFDGNHVSQTGNRTRIAPYLLRQGAL
ncbi:MAG TPA: acyltransferase family protein [Allosphingosinicella sp.]|jgi:peptidoglycan/LPS O-acetylase OafA/YrhL|uniref:acyltransferase family protein n=1 Tax=Allosphingosinicella sp. TaxID=2823234 RepID=UPI002F2ACF4A